MNNVEFVQGMAPDLNSVVAGMTQVLKEQFADKPVRLIGFAFLPEMRQVSPLDPKPTYMVTMVLALEHEAAAVEAPAGGIVKSFTDQMIVHESPE